MGGWGSGSYYRYNSKTTVESALRLTIRSWVRAGLIAPGTRKVGAWCWRDGQGRVVSSIEYVVNTIDHALPRLRLFYNNVRTSERQDYSVLLEQTPCHYGGARWWYRCPIKGCGRRCGVLYLPPGGNLFACRRCYGLVYQSSNDSRSRIRSLAATFGVLGLGEISALPTDEQLLPALEALFFADKQDRRELLKDVKRQPKERGPGRPTSHEAAWVRYLKG